MTAPADRREAPVEAPEPHRTGEAPATGPVQAERGALRRVLPQGRAFLAGRKRVLWALGGWSLLESAQTFLGGYGVARALDDGFLAGRTGVGLLWLAVAGAATVLGGLAVRGVFSGLAGLVEPLRDGLVRRAVSRALATAVADPARADSTAVSRLTHQTEMARDSFAGLVLTARSFVFTALGALVGMASLAPALLLVVLPPLLLGLGLFLATLAPMAAAQRAFLDADEALSGRVAAVGAGLRDVAAAGGDRRITADVGRLITTESLLAHRLARWAAVRTLALGAAGRLPVVALLLATPWLLGQGVTAGTLLGALTYLMQALLPALHTLMAALGAAGTRLLVVLDRFSAEVPWPPEPHGARPPGPGTRGKGKAPGTPPGPPAAEPPPGPPAAEPPPGPPAAGPRPASRAAAELRGVTFAWGPAARPVLEGLDLVVAEGEHLAVVGPSGIGKSTLTAVIAGLLTPDRGTVLLDGAPVRQAGARDPDLRRALLPQQAHVFTGTVRDNLRYLSPEARPAQVAQALEALGLDPLVGRLGGLDAMVAPDRLSQGESQRLALARAYLSPAPLLLLDEATCHLDPDTEERAERQLAARPGTLIVVAHRLSSAARADRVLVLDGTRAVCGTHQELLARSELYRDLVGVGHPDAY
ncbi:ABC transporter ATP-binding protein [Streptomyces sp. SP18CS02]|uniref:ABC transporter ATP-binding protein n=1 Tax=Streptomyces sp. SP18CS02 TaxID=3002531 RepID=UPI002E77C9BA|nr:ABC transporter ATP-binding protein [Streptomyces sp. SP18CS02]MEE1752033.1 ABC transporter ATP-binding protein [Streptomyces sp. SP18CS02]